MHLGAGESHRLGRARESQGGRKVPGLVLRSGVIAVLAGDVIRCQLCARHHGGPSG